MKARYPFPQLQVGDALHIHMPAHTERDRRRIREAAYQYGQRHERKLSVVKNECGVTVKRIA